MIEILLNHVIPVLILVIGTLTNLTGMVVFSSKRLKKLQIAPTYVYIWMFLINEIVILQFIVIYLMVGFNYNLVSETNLVCKLYRILSVSLHNMSPFMLVYISFDHLINIKFTNHRHILKKLSNQLIFTILNIFFNVVFCIPNFLFNQKQTYLNYLTNRDLINFTLINQNNISTISLDFFICDYVDFKSQMLLGYMAVIIRVPIPYIFMLGSSIAIVYTIYQTRRRISCASTNTFKKDVKFSISSISLNLLYMIMVLPVSVSLFQTDIYREFTFVILASYVFYFSYIINFFILFFTNSVFRRCLYDLIKRNKHNFQRGSPS